MTAGSNPYEAPSSDLRSEGPRGAPIKGLLAGVAVDLGGSIVLGLGIGIVYGFSLAAEGLREAEILERLKAMPLGSPLHILSLSAGLLLSLAGGYVGSRIARRDELRLGALQALIVVGFGALMGGGAYPLPVQIALSLLTFFTVMGGAWLGRQRNMVSQGS